MKAQLFYVYVFVCVGGWRWWCGLDEGAGALLAEWINPLAGEAVQEAVILLVFVDELDDVGDRLRDEHALDGGLAAQLLRHSALLL